MHFNRKILTALLAAAIGSCAYAQEYRLPGQHNQQNADLLANQEFIGDQIILTVNNYINFDEEEEPEYDIYTEGWESNAVNCYAGMDVPDRITIDVSKYAMPCPGYVTSPYGYRKRFKRQHKGIDLKVQVGDTIYAAFDGKVRLTKFEKKGYGYYVVLRHTNDLETVYGHLSKFLVEPNQYVKAGDPIALGGNTGRSTGPHLHFETRYMGYAINPAAIFDFANQTTHTDTYTFDKNTYQNARNFDPKANAEYAEQYWKEHPRREVPKSASSGSSSGSKSVKVKKGDTLGAIAKRNGTTVAKLCKLNGIKSSTTLRVGQTIKIR